MRLRFALVAAAAVASASAAEAQLAVRLQGVSTSHVEVDNALKATGFGAAAGVEFSVADLRVDVSAYRSWLDPDDFALESFSILQADVRVRYDLTPTVAAEVGAGRRYTDPVLAAQDVGLFRVGLRAGTGLASIAQIWGRGAYLLAPQFSGGGSAPFAFEIGLGALLGGVTSSVRARVEYTFERLDRSVNSLDAPIQMSVARVGVEWRP